MYKYKYKWHLAEHGTWYVVQQHQYMYSRASLLTQSSDFDRCQLSHVVLRYYVVMVCRGLLYAYCAASVH